MINVTEVRPGNYFVDEGNLYRVIDILLNKIWLPGRRSQNRQVPDAVSL